LSVLHLEVYLRIFESSAEDECVAAATHRTAGPDGQSASDPYSLSWYHWKSPTYAPSPTISETNSQNASITEGCGGARTARTGKTSRNSGKNQLLVTVADAC
jgi:hypothetical protein